VRPVKGVHKTLRAGGMGRVRLMLAALPLVLVPSAAPAVHAARAADRFALTGAKADERQSSWESWTPARRRQRVATKP
jgi:hypothetical protein